MQNLINQTIDNRYQITRLLGQGNMGAVYLAQDVRLERQVAIKVLRADLAERSAFRAQFEREAKTLAQLEHPGIVRVHDVAATDQFLYIVMDYLPGQSLEQRLSDLRAQLTGLELSEALELVRQVCEALAYAHQQGIIHRDIKPANIILAPEPSGMLPYRPVLTDFGLARLLEGELEAGTQRPSRAGTPAYASPEQAAGDPLTAQSDIYSLGVLLYQLVTGRRPFDFGSMAEAAASQRSSLTPPRSLRPDLPESVEAIVLKAMAVAPAQRYPSTTEMCEALEAVIPKVESLSIQPLMLRDIATDPDEPSTASDEPSIGRDEETAPDEELFVAAAAPGSGVLEQVGLRLATDHLTVDPGGRVTLEATVSNLSHRTRHFRLQVEGIIDSWLPDFPAPIRLFREGLDNSEGPMTLTFSPPRIPASKAGDYEIWISAVSENDEVRSERQLLTLTVKEFQEFNTELWPEVYRSGQKAPLQIYNKGNASQSYTVRGFDSADEVRFRPTEKIVDIEPGENETVDFKVSSRQVNFFGRSQDYPFTLQVTPPPFADKEPAPQEHRGTVRSRRLIPPWVLLVLLALLCIPITASVFLYGQSRADEVFIAGYTPPTSPLPSPTPTVEAILNLTVSKKTIEPGESVELRWQAQGLELVYLNGELVTDQSKLVHPTETTTYVISGQRSATDQNPVVVAQTVVVRELKTEAVTFSQFPDGAAVCPGCKLEGSEYEDQSLIFTVAGNELPARCLANKPILAVLGGRGLPPALTTVFTQWNAPQQSTPTPRPCPTRSCNSGCTGSIEIPTCRSLVPTATPTRSPLQNCSFAPFKVIFLEATRVATFTFAGQTPQAGSYRVTDAAAPADAAAAAADNNNFLRFEVGPGRRIKDVTFGLDGRWVGITKIEYEFLNP